jgi:hypothetical protein
LKNFENAAPAALSKRSELTKLAGNAMRGVGFAASQAIVTIARIF